MNPQRRTWLDTRDGTLHQIEFWPEIIGTIWPHDIEPYLKAIEWKGREYPKRIMRYTRWSIGGPVGYGIIEYESIEKVGDHGSGSD